MRALSKILNRRCIKLEMQATKKQDAIEELVEILVQAGKVANAEELVEEVLAQEKQISTGIGDGVAIPHIMTKQVKKTIMAFGRKKEGVPFDALDHQPVYLFFLILGPQGKPHLHLQLLSRLSRLLHDYTFKKNLLEAQSPDEILEALRRKESE